MGYLLQSDLTEKEKQIGGNWMFVPRAGYTRSNIKDLVKLDKPVIVTAKYYKKDDESTLITFHDIHLYSSGEVMPDALCHHINIFQTQILELTGEYWHKDEHESKEIYVLTCRPYLYTSNNDPAVIRGGLKLTGELSFGPILRAENLGISVPQEKYIDFHLLDDSFKGSTSQFNCQPHGPSIPRNMSKRNKARLVRKSKKIYSCRQAAHVRSLINYIESV